MTAATSTTDLRSGFSGCCSACARVGALEHWCVPVRQQRTDTSLTTSFHGYEFFNHRFFGSRLHPVGDTSSMEGLQLRAVYHQSRNHLVHRCHGVVSSHDERIFPRDQIASPQLCDLALRDLSVLHDQQYGLERMQYHHSVSIMTTEPIGLTSSVGIFARSMRRPRVSEAGVPML